MTKAGRTCLAAKRTCSPGTARNGAGRCAALARRWEFRRGCLEGVTLSLQRFLDHAEQLFRLAPIRHVHFTDEGPDLKALRTCPLWSRVSEVTMRLGGATDVAQQLGPLVHSQHARQFRALRIRSRLLLAETVLPVLETLSGLETIDIQVCSGRLAPLTRMARWPRLRCLHLTHCWLRLDQVVHILSVARSLPLQELDLTGNPLDSEGTTWPRSGTPVASFVELLPPRLHTLDLRGCYLSRAFAVALARSRHLPRLTRLDVGFNSLGRQGLEALITCPHLNRLTHLGLARLAVEQTDSRSWLEMLDTPNLPRLAALDLSCNDLDASAARVLAATSLPDRLYRLDLRHNRLGDGGALALLAADWPRLAWLDLRDNGLTPYAREQLRQRFGYTVHY